MEQIRAQSSFITAISPVVGRAADVAHGEEQLANVGINGVTNEYLIISGYEVTSGRFLTDADERDDAAGGGASARTWPRGSFPASARWGRRSASTAGPSRWWARCRARGRSSTTTRIWSVLVPFKTFYAAFGKQRPFSIAIAVDERGAR